MNVIMPVRDQGTAYEMPASSYKAALTEVRRGTPMGELLRRYWHPVGLSADAGTTPRQVKALGENLILFREKSACQTAEQIDWKGDRCQE